MSVLVDVQTGRSMGFKGRQGADFGERRDSVQTRAEYCSQLDRTS